MTPTADNVIPFRRKPNSLAERAAHIAREQMTARLRKEMDAEAYQKAYKARREALRNGSHFLDDEAFQATAGLVVF